MAEETQKPAEEVIAAAPLDTTSKDAPPAQVEEVTEPAAAAVEEVAEEAEKPAAAAAEDAAAEEKKISQSVSFKEESNVVADLPEPQKKALDDLKQLIQDALNKHELSAPPPPKAPSPSTEAKKDEVAAAATEEKVEEEEEKKTEEEKKPDEEEKKEEVVEEEKKPAEEEKKAEAEGEATTSGEEKNVVEAVTEVVVEAGEKTVEAIKETIVSVVAVGEEEEGKEAPPEIPSEPEEVSIWGIPLLADERSDVVLLKFLRARDFKVKDAFTMIKNTVRWRKEFGIDALVDEDLGSEWDKVVFTQGHDKLGHAVCYNVFGEFEDKELYQKTFSDDEKRQKFIKWRIQVLEKSVRKLDFSPTPTAISTIVQVNDLKNSPGLGKWELRQATNQALQLLQDNYPEFVAKQVFINVPWWYLAFSRMISPFLTQRTKSKFVFAGPSKSAETLFKYIAPELVPVQYGGLSREGEQEFTTADPVTEVTIKPATKHAVELPVSEKGHLAWELRVVGWDVNYGAEFVPGAEDGYTVIVQKNRKIGPADETVISNSFKVGEAGKVVLTIDNQTSKKKKLLYRSKTTPISD
ncbi:patellin-3 [Lotus japonicus]|uniref:patellin-3 n=1 Tax=Lotus japonicus TaxID=34305 RepID=UPI00258FB395|nr:patellin-3 [Lotus japonicus]